MQVISIVKDRVNVNIHKCLKQGNTWRIIIQRRYLDFSLFIQDFPLFTVVNEVLEVSGHNLKARIMTIVPCHKYLKYESLDSGFFIPLLLYRTFVLGFAELFA